MVFFWALHSGTFSTKICSVNSESKEYLKTRSKVASDLTLEDTELFAESVKQKIKAFHNNGRDIQDGTLS